MMGIKFSRFLKNGVFDINNCSWSAKGEKSPLSMFLNHFFSSVLYPFFLCWQFTKNGRNFITKLYLQTIIFLKNRNFDQKIGFGKYWKLELDGKMLKLWLESLKAIRDI